MQKHRVAYIIVLLPNRATVILQIITGDGIVDAKDRTSIGNPQPKVFGGLSLDASYKAWDFNLYFYGSFGNKILNYVESHLESFQKRGSEGVQNVSQKYYRKLLATRPPFEQVCPCLAQ